MAAIITWNCVGDSDSCGNCLALDGQEFTIDTLPGWPGDGSFGNSVLCEGGPRCRCTLSYSDTSGNVAVGTSDLAQQWNMGTLQSDLGPAGQVAAWLTAQQAFIDQLPDIVQPGELYSTAARAAMRLQIRQQIGAQLGINPADVSAAAVANALPSAYKAAKGMIGVVRDILAKTYPDDAIDWITQMNWAYRNAVPLEEISVTGPSSESDAESIAKKVKKLKKGKPLKPLVLIDPGEDGLLQVADGHHRCAAALEADLSTVPAYVGTVHSDDDWRKEVMDMQMVRAKKGVTIAVIPPADTLNGDPDFGATGTGPTSADVMSGGVVKEQLTTYGTGEHEAVIPLPKAVIMVEDPSDDPVNHMLAEKNFSLVSPLASGFVPFDLAGPEITVRFAGLLLMAADTGRVLMLQRSLSDDDPASGQWEIPGGHLEDGEEPLEAAIREWREEVGSPLPQLKIVGRWVSANGYQGFLGLCTHETDIDIKDRSLVNPDDPDDDNPEAVAWFWPSDLVAMPGVRREAREQTPWSRIMAGGSR